MFKVVAINDSYSICVNAGQNDITIEDKLFIIGSYNKELKVNDEILGRHYYIKAQVRVIAIFDKYCICESDEDNRLKKMPLSIDPNQLSGITKEIAIGDIVLSQTN